MGRVFELIYVFFRQHLWAFLLFMALVISFEAWFGSRIRLEEDINKVIPSSEKNSELLTVLQHSNFADRMVICITQNDSDAPAKPEMLIQYAETLIDSLENSRLSQYIEKIEGKFSTASFTGIYDLFYENLPLFLNEEDYDSINNKLSDSAIALAIKKDYEALISPGSFVMRDFILKDPLSLTPLALKKLEKLKVSDNFELYNGYIFSLDRRNLLFFFIPANPSTETSENAELLGHINKIRDGLNKEYGNEIIMLYFGSMAASISNAAQIKADIILTVSIAALLLIAFLGFYFRRKLAFLLLFVPAIFGGGLAIALLYLIKAEVSAISLGLGSVMLGISIDYALHFLTHLRHTGSVRTVIKDIGGPVMMSSITTASAFLCLLVLKSEAMRDLGLFAALSVFSSAIFTLVLLPMLFKEKQGTSVSKNNIIASLINRIAAYSYDRKGKLVWLILVLLLMFIFTSRNVSFESSMDSMNYLTEDLSASEDYLDSISSYKLKSVFVVSKAANIEDALSGNEKLLPLGKNLVNEGLAASYFSVHEFYPSSVIRDEKKDRWNAFWPKDKIDKVKNSISKASRVYRFKENTFDQFYSLLAFDRNINIEDLSALRNEYLNEYITETDSLVLVTSILKVREEDKPAVYKAYENSENVIIFDRQSLTSSFMEGLHDDFDLLIILSLAMVFIILTASFGRIELGIITFIPLLISWTWTLGIMGLFGIKFNIFNVIISTFIFGLGIDYAIFCMRGLMQEYQYGRKNLSSYKTSILLSGLTTLTGIGVLIFARHPALQSIAISAIIGIVSVIFITYTMLPRLFRFLVEHEGRSRKWPATLYDFLFSINTVLIFLVGIPILVISRFVIQYLLPISTKKKKLVFHRMVSAGTWIIVYGSWNIKKHIWNKGGEDFKKPAIVICNHQSHLDTVLTIMQNHKMILLTNPWVQKSIFYRGFIQYADFYSVADGHVELMQKIRALVKDGYSVLYFPEGTRSPDMEIGRFHQGAFRMARELELDLLPIISYGSGNVMPKFEPFLKTSPVTMTILPRIQTGDPLIKDTDLATAKSMRKFYKENYAEIRKKIETPVFFRKMVVRNYLYRGPVLEWYMKVKIRMENNYLQFHEILPERGIISDIGCGYGFMTYMLQLMAPGRSFYAYDYDKDKIETAQNCALKNKNIHFKYSDVEKAEFKESDAFILADVLHYMPDDAQELLISNCAAKLNNDGLIIIRDGDRGMSKKHAGTRISEFFSTRLGFNRTRSSDYKLFFTSKERIMSIFAKLGMDVEVVDHTKMTSNLIYIAKKRK